jgi:hypothetical protein
MLILDNVLITVHSLLLPLWKESIMAIPVKSFITFIIEDPSKLYNGQPVTTHQVYVSINREFNEVINDKTKVVSELLNDAIMEVTIDKDRGYEMRDGMGGYTEYNCSNCAGGLLLSACSSCGLLFEDDYFRCGWSTPLPLKIINHLVEQGHEFPVVPSIAHEKEKLISL